MADKEEIEETKEEIEEIEETTKGEIEEIEETVKVPDEWAEIPFQDFFDKGYRPWIQKQKKRGKSYIALKKGDDVKTIGPYSKDKWKLLVDMYPYPLPQLSPDSPPIDERIAELKKEKLGKRMIAQTLYDEGYSTKEMMHYGYSPNLLKPKMPKETELTDKSMQAAVRGATRGPGYLQELKDMVQKQISLSREFAESCTNAGVKVLFAALKRGAVSGEDINKITGNVGALENVVDKATQTALKAIEYYDIERIKRLEDERDEARVACSQMAAEFKAVEKALEPKATLERIIYAYVMSPNVDGNTFTALVDRLLSMEMSKLRSKVLAG